MRGKDHILFNQNEKHDFNQILAYHFRIPAYHTTRFLIRIMSYTGIIPVNIPHCLGLFGEREQHAHRIAGVAESAPVVSETRREQGVPRPCASA